LDFGFGWVTEGELRGDRVGGSLRVGVRDEIWGDGMWWMKYGGWNVVEVLCCQCDTLNCAFRWTHTNFLTFHAIQILTMIVKN
jgi:hypothetical protein